MDQAINGLSVFMTYMKQAYDTAHPNGTDGNLYKGLIKEEFLELMAEKSGTVKDFKEALDNWWVDTYYFFEQKYPIVGGIRELCMEFNSKFYNDGKFNPKYREDGKLMKGTGFRKGNYEQFFEEK